MEKESTISISERTYSNGSQLEHALQKADAVDKALTKWPDAKLHSIWASKPHNNPFAEPERGSVAINENLLRGINRVAFTRYIDLIEGEEVELANDILSQHQPEGCPVMNNSRETSARR